MTVASPHVTNADIGRFLRRTLPAADLVRFSDHLAECVDCRRRAGAPIDPMVVAAAFADGPGFDEDAHVPEADIHAFVEGRLDGDRREAISAHLEACPACADDIRDLTAFAATFGRASGRRRSPWTYGVLAAAAVVVVAAGTGLIWRSSRGSSGTPLASSEGGALDGVNAAQVRDALASGRLSLPPEIAQLTGRQGTLLGSGDGVQWGVVSPVGTAVLDMRPMLRWTPAPESPSYIVTLQDQSTGETVSSPPLQRTEWMPGQPLVRGHTYSWQVAAGGRREIVAPRPPDPPARFVVADEATAIRLEHLAASPLARGILYANAGLLDDAERELQASATAGQDTTLVNGFLAQLRQARVPSGR